MWITPDTVKVFETVKSLLNLTDFPTLNELFNIVPLDTVSTLLITTSLLIVVAPETVNVDFKSVLLATLKLLDNFDALVIVNSLPKTTDFPTLNVLFRTEPF